MERTTDLDDFTSCPISFFFERVLSLEDRPEVIEELSARERGSLYHRILADFYRRLLREGIRVGEDVLPGLQEIMSEVVTGVFGEWKKVNPAMDEHLIEVEREIARRLFEGYLEREVLQVSKEAGKSFERVPRYFELAFGPKEWRDFYDPASARDAFLIEEEGFRLKVGGVVDRIDSIFAGGGDRPLYFFVLDYKTSSAPTAREVLEGKSLQLPLYVLACESLVFHKMLRPAGASFYILAEGKERQILLNFEGIAKRGRPVSGEDFPRTLETARRVAVERAKRIYDGEFPPLPAEVCPPECPNRTICRFSRFKRLSVERR